MITAGVSHFSCNNLLVHLGLPISRVHSSPERQANQAKGYGQPRRCAVSNVDTRKLHLLPLGRCRVGVIRLITVSSFQAAQKRNATETNSAATMKVMTMTANDVSTKAINR